MEQEQRTRLDAEKIQAEIRKLDQETEAMRGQARRAWVTVLSIVAGVVFTVFQIYEVTRNIALREEQLAMESRIRSQQLFLDILPKMSGFKSIKDRWDDEADDYVIDSRDREGDLTIVGAYASAVALGCRFEDLRLPAQAALFFQRVVQPKDIGAETLHKRLQEGCADGWDGMNEAEMKRWVEIIRSPDYRRD